MFCTNCGQPLQPNATACLNCGTRVRQYSAPPAVPNYLVPSILVTLCCCLPFGIIAVVYAAQVNSKLAAGDVAGAQAASKNAKMWTWIAFGFGLVATILSLVMGVFSGFTQQ